MNNNQTYILMAVVAIMVAMLLFPPFVQETRIATYNKGYQFILSAPEYVVVNTGLLLMQWIAVVAAGGAAWFFFKDREWFNLGNDLLWT